MGCNPPGSSVHGILQIRILEWVSMPSSRGSSHLGIELLYLCLLHWQAGSLPLAPSRKLIACRIFFFFFFSSVGTVSCGMWDLVPWLDFKRGPPALGEWSLSHWATREVLSLTLLIVYLRLSKKLSPMTSKTDFLTCYKISVHTWDTIIMRVPTGDKKQGKPTLSSQWNFFRI